MATVSLERAHDLFWGFAGGDVTTSFSTWWLQPQKFLYSDSPHYADLLQYNYTVKHA